MRGLQERMDELQNQLSSLQVVAPADGVLSSRTLKHLEGTYVKKGDELAAIGSENKKRLRMLVEQDSGNQIASIQQIRFLSIDGTSGSARVERCLPRISKQADNSSLGA